MSTKTVESAGIEAVPFFARFLEDQSVLAKSEEPPAEPPADRPPVPPYPPLPFTIKYPSDWEDR
ncbi:esterase [Scytonema hofmannii PCC 7110]|uniref:Esterase n=1 Tax=Scytonema hofmannii PCC 7110 TaxID=128403 RepID=A0A139XDG6_9CYAN|nr:microviridin/marinostatin family tricyclic proteinase inhibitor [Scytonema hofmannii]KYC42739.1 esterase [Scytonema hofmannii PCC 7110]